MKSMLYVGSILMIGACIYGFADYKKASHIKEFKSLYNEQGIKKANPETTTPAPAPINDKEEVNLKENKKTSAIAAIENRVIAKRKIKSEKKLSYKLFSRAPLKKFKPPEIIKDETK